MSLVLNSLACERNGLRTGCGAEFFVQQNHKVNAGTGKKPVSAQSDYSAPSTKPSTYEEQSVEAARTVHLNVGFSAESEGQMMTAKLLRDVRCKEFNLVDVEWTPGFLESRG